MNLCLTSKSVKLLGTYFKNNLEGLVNDKVTYQDIQLELYTKALSDFKSDSLTRDKELIIQHLTILPHIVSQYLGENNINNSPLLTEANSKKTTVYNSTTESSMDSFQQVVDDITSSIGVGGIVIPPIVRQTGQNQPRGGSYNAVAFSYAKTISQESIIGEDGTYLDNVTDPAKEFEIAVQTSIIKDNNSKGYMYKMMTIEQIENDPSITYQYPTEQKDRPVLVVIDKDGKVLKFDNQGNVSETGTTPAFPIRISKDEYATSVKLQIEAYVERDKMTPAAAKALVEKELSTHIDMLEDARKRLAASESQPTSEVDAKTVTRKEQIADLFEANPKLAKVGTVEQYSAYLNTVFPNSTYKEILYHGTNAKFEEFLSSKSGSRKEGAGSTGSDVGAFGRGTYLTPNKKYSEVYGKIPLATIINLKSPKLIVDNEANDVLYQDKSIKEQWGKDKDGVIFEAKDWQSIVDSGEHASMEDFNRIGLGFTPEIVEIAVSNANQIHVLGSKKDVAGFKDFVTQQTSEVDAKKTKLEKVNAQIKEAEKAETTVEKTTVEETPKKPVVKTSWLATPTDKGEFYVEHESGARKNNISLYRLEEHADGTASMYFDTDALGFSRATNTIDSAIQPVAKSLNTEDIYAKEINTLKPATMVKRGDMWVLKDGRNSKMEIIYGPIEVWKKTEYGKKYFTKSTETIKPVVPVELLAEQVKLKEEIAALESKPTQQTSEAEIFKGVSEFAISGITDGFNYLSGNKADSLDDVRNITRSARDNFFHTEVKDGRKIFAYIAIEMPDGRGIREHGQAGRDGYISVSLSVPENSIATLSDFMFILEAKANKLLDASVLVQEQFKGPGRLAMYAVDKFDGSKPVFKSTPKVEEVEEVNDVTFFMDMTKSSLGFSEINQSKQTPIRDIVNLNDLEISVKTLGKSNSAVLLIPNSNTPAKIHNKPLADSSKETIDNLIELMSNPNLTFYGKPLSLAMREKLITTQIQYKAEKKYKSDVHFKITQDGKKITTVTVGNQAIRVSGKQFAEKFKAAINKFHGFPYKGIMPTNYKIVEGLENVTFQNQIYVDNGINMQARKTEVNFGLYNAGSINVPVDIVTGIVNNEVSVKKQERYEFIKDNGYSIVVPNSKGEVRGFSSYISYTSMKFKSDVDNVGDPEIFFTSVSESNKRTKATKAEDTAADLWWKNSPLNGPIKRYISKEVNVKGPKFIADFMNDSINLWAGSDKTETYHEALHGYMQGLLTEAERTEVYKEVTDQVGNFVVTVLGKTKVVKYKNATDLEVQEYLATEFRSYAVNRSKFNKKPKSKIAIFFKNLLEQLKKMFGKFTPNEVVMLDKFGPKVNAMFQDLYEGNFDISKFEAPSDNIMFNSSFQVAENLDLSIEQLGLVMESMNGLMNRFVTKALNPSTNPKDTAKFIKMMSELTSLDVNNPEYKIKAKAIQSEINNFSDFRHGNGLGYLRLLSSPTTLSGSLQYIKNVLTQRRAIDASKPDDIIAQENVALLDKVLGNFGDTKLPMSKFKGDDTTIIGIYMNSYSNFLQENVFVEDIAWDDTNIEDNFRLVFDRTGAEQTVDEAANELTRQLLSSIPSYKNEGKGRENINRLGIPQSVPFKTLISKLVKITNNKTDLDSIYMSLREASVTDKEVKAVLEMMGFLGAEETTLTEQKQWGAVWQSITKANNPLRYYSMEKIDEVTEEVNEKDEKVKVVKYNSSTGQDTRNLSVIRGQWKDNFKFISEQDDTFYTTNEKNTEERHLAADDLGEFIISDLENLVYIPEYNTGELYHEKRQTGVAYKSDRVRKWQADPFELLNILGIELPETHEVRNAILHGDENLGIDAGVMQYIKDSIENRTTAVLAANKEIYKLEDLFKSFKYFSTSAGKKIEEVQEDVSGYFLQLQRIAQLLSDEYTNFSNFNVNGDRMSEKTKHSSMTIIVSTLNNAEHYDDLLEIPGMEGFDVDTNPILAGNNWFVQMFNLDKTDSRKGVRNKDMKITTETLSGSKVVYGKEDKGVVSMGSDEFTKFIADFHLTLEARQEILRSSDKSTSAVVSAPTMVDGELRKGLVINQTDILSIYEEGYDDSSSPYTLKLWNQFQGAIEGEMIRMTRIQSIKDRINKGETVKFDPAYLKRGNEFFMFHLLLTPEIQNKLKNINLDESFTLNNILTHKEKKDIEKSLKEYFAERADELYKEKGSQLTISDNKLKDLRINEIETVEDIKQRSMKMFVINNFLQNVNYTTLFLGDMAIYNIEADDFHKRIAGAISTGDIFRFDDTWYNFINSKNIEINGFAKKHMKASGKTYVENAYTGHLYTGVMKESKHDSFYIKHYAKIAGINTKAYKDMEEADGQGWISMDSYRKLALSAHDWSDAQEELYQKMLNDEPIDLLETTTFPVKKYQFYGDVSNVDNENYGLQPKAFHKYSLAPIIPSMYKKDGPMKDLNEKMMENNMDYVTMSSGSKLSTIVTIDGSQKNALELAEADDIYTKERIINKKVPFTINKIHIRGLKNQVKASEGYKGYITLPTQWRKMIMLGVMDGNKKPTDYTGTLSQWKKLSKKDKLAASPNYQWVTKFERILNDMEVKLKEDLLYDIGMKEIITTKNGKKVISYEGNTKKLLSYIEAQLKDEELLPEEIEFIKNPITGEMIDDLSYSLIAEKIEKILVTMVDKKLRRLKVNGEGLVQLSGSLQEDTQSAAFIKPTDAEIQKYGTM